MIGPGIYTFMSRIRLIALAILMPVTALADIQPAVDPDTGLLSWKLERDGFGIELIQLKPDYVRALYSSRGLPADIIEEVARYCVFGTIVRNLSDSRRAYRVAEWRFVTADGKQHRPRTKTEWITDWKQRGLRYLWSLLPDDQVFEVGDWSQGFTTIDVPRHSRFDLSIQWHVKGRTYSHNLSGLTCAQ